MKTNYIGADVHCKMTELAVERNGKIVVRDRVPTDIRSLGRFLNSITGKKVMVNRIKFIADAYGITAEDLDEHHMYPCICGLQDLSWDIITNPNDLEKLIKMRREGKSGFEISMAFRRG